MPKSLGIRGLVTTTQPAPDFSGMHGFCEVSHNVELIAKMKFPTISMTGCRDKGNKFQKYP